MPFTVGIPWKKPSSAAFAVPVDQALPKEEEGEERGPPVSCGWWWKFNPGRMGDSIGARSLLLPPPLLLLGAETARSLPVDGLSGSAEEEVVAAVGSDDEVGAVGGGSTCVGV